MVSARKESWAEHYPFESNYLTLESGAQMHYLDEGPVDAPVLFMIHGNPTWSFYYRNLVIAFRDRFRCVVPDHIGCGLSDKPQDYEYTLAQRIEDLCELSEHLGLRNVSMVVHDWGGAIGMGWATRHVELVDKLVVFNTAAFRSDFIPFSIDICRIPIFGDIAVRGLNGFVRAAQVRAIYHRELLTPEIRDAYLQPYNSWKNRVAIHEFVKDIPMSPEHPTYDVLVEVEEGLEKLRERPMLIVWGERDFCFNSDFRREWERRFPDAEVHALEDASHFVVEDATESIIGWMDTFLTALREAGESSSERDA